MNLGTSTHMRRSDERRAQSATTWAEAPSKKEGWAWRFSVMAEMNSQS